MCQNHDAHTKFQLGLVRNWAVKLYKFNENKYMFGVRVLINFLHFFVLLSFDKKLVRLQLLA